MAAPENTSKPNFAERPKRNFDQLNCSDVQTRVSSRRNVSGLKVEHNRGEEGVNRFTLRWSVTSIPSSYHVCPGYEIKHGTIQEQINEHNISSNRTIKQDSNLLGYDGIGISIYLTFRRSVLSATSGQSRNSVPDQNYMATYPSVTMRTKNLEL